MSHGGGENGKRVILGYCKNAMTDMGKRIPGVDLTCWRGDCCVAVNTENAVVFQSEGGIPARGGKYLLGDYKIAESSAKVTAITYNLLHKRKKDKMNSSHSTQYICRPHKPTRDLSLQKGCFLAGAPTDNCIFGFLN